MKKPELIAKVAEECSVSKKDAKNVIDTTFETIKNELSKGKSVTFVGFGTFSTSHRKARTARVPNTDRVVDVPAKTIAKFKAGKVLSEAVKG